MRARKIVVATLAALGLAAAATVGFTQGAGGGPGYGPGYGWGPGMMGGYGPGGMMGGYGPGGMMGGYGPGGTLGIANLTDEQREKIVAIQEENRRKNWNAMGQLRNEQFKLREMYYGDKVDANAVAEQQKKVDELRRQMIKSHVEARNQIAAVLTPEQRKQLRQLGPWWLSRDGDGGE
jgi:Spy/CpxP family protein refolding chaperone